MFKIHISTVLFLMLPALWSGAQQRDKTTFQTGSHWKPETDVRADVAIVYGTGDSPAMTFEQRVDSWRKKGYNVQFMTGIAWGEYQDYFTGKWDGKNHLGEGQKNAKGDTIWHGKMVPYIVPTDSFLTYMIEKHIKRAINAGIEVIYLEEPEFWARAGYSQAFKNEWKKFYGTEWQAPHLSPTNTYLSNKLKYHLYYRALDTVFSFAKAYGKSKGMNIKCYVPTHSLVNYSAWSIVSPEASLASLNCVDGYIAQVWTGTSREKTYYNGVEKERVFENAFLEYGSMESMTRPTGRKMYFLTDPIEDRARDWGDYKKNYEATFTAQLLYPMVDQYEVMPWPDRIYQGLYNKPGSDVKERIPRYYSTQMQVMVNALNQMPKTANRVSGSHGIAVAMANSLMFQRFPTHNGYEDPQLSNFYGQALPFLKRGVPVSVVHLENVGYPETLKEVKILILSYSNMKPLSESIHDKLAGWVKKGGMLVYCGRDNDPFQNVKEWWNSGNNTFETPSQHLFHTLKIKNSEGLYRFGKGKVLIIKRDPKEFVMTQNSDQSFVEQVTQLYNEKKGSTLVFKNNFTLSRGIYSIVSVMDENQDNNALILKGKWVDLFDPALPVLYEKTVYPGTQAFLVDIEKASQNSDVFILASASRIYDEIKASDSYSFVAKSPLNTTNAMRILLPRKPLTVVVSEQNGQLLKDIKNMWDDGSKTLFLGFENNPDGVYVKIKW